MDRVRAWRAPFLTAEPEVRAGRALFAGTVRVVRRPDDPGALGSP